MLVRAYINLCLSALHEGYREGDPPELDDSYPAELDGVDVYWTAS